MPLLRGWVCSILIPFFFLFTGSNYILHWYIPRSFFLWEKMSEDGIILNTDLQLEEMAGQPTTSESGAQNSLTPATTAVTSQMQTVTTSTSQQRLMMGMGSFPFLNPAGPTQTQVAYQQVDLGQYIDQQVQSKISDYWQQQSNMAALMQMPQTRPQFPTFYPSGPMAMMGGLSGNSMYPSASGMGLPTNASATQSGVLKQQQRQQHLI